MAGAPALTGTDRPIRVLVVEDEESYREALRVGLAKEGYDVDLASDGIEGLRRFREAPPDIVLLDLLLPGMAGTDVCRQMRAISDAPIIIVTALDSEVDVVLGLELGAADYVTKPYHLRELTARIQAVLRRSAPLPVATVRSTPEVIEAGQIRVNIAQRYVSVGNRPVYLSRLEFDLLAVLLDPPGQVRTRDELIDRLWAGRELTDTRTLDTHVRRLRLKLEADPAAPLHLLTVRGVGFRFDPEGRGSPAAPHPGGRRPDAR